MLPYINYGIMAWCLNCNKNIKLQGKNRIIYLAKYNAHTDPLFKKLNILNVTNMLTLHELILYFNYAHMSLPVYLQHLPLTLNKTVYKFKTPIHDYYLYKTRQTMH
jgi:hypothetical protein